MRTHHILGLVAAIALSACSTDVQAGAGDGGTTGVSNGQASATAVSSGAASSTATNGSATASGTAGASTATTTGAATSGASGRGSTGGATSGNLFTNACPSCPTGQFCQYSCFGGVASCVAAPTPCGQGACSVCGLTCECLYWSQDAGTGPCPSSIANCSVDGGLVTFECVEGC